MARFVTLTADFEPWSEESDFARGGVLVAIAGLRLRGQRVLHGEPVAANLAARGLVRSALEGHEPGGDSLAALLPCPLDLSGRGGVVRDARVRIAAHDTRARIDARDTRARIEEDEPCGEERRGRARGSRRVVVIDELVGFDDAPPGFTTSVPWPAWARQAVKLGTWAVRRCPAEPPTIVAEQHRDACRALREETRELLRHLRAELRGAPDEG